MKERRPPQPPFLFFTEPLHVTALLDQAGAFNGLGESFLGEAIVMRVTKSIVLGIAATFILGTGIISAAAANAPRAPMAQP
jgi:hypothetical protein